MSKQTGVRSTDNLRRLATRWLSADACAHATELTCFGNVAAKELGRRSSYLPLAVPLALLPFAFAPSLRPWPIASGVLFALLILTAIGSALAARRLAAGNPEEPLKLARYYRITIATMALIWGGLVGQVILTQGISQVAELALFASVGLTVAGLAALALELSLWRQFVLMLWLPIMLSTARAAMDGTSNAWLLLGLEISFVTFIGAQGTRLVHAHVTGLLSRHDLENAASTIDDQRDELRAQQKRLNDLLTKTHDLSHYDQLTGLGNRVDFHERLEARIASRPSSGNTFAILYLDLDSFKDINDTFGHSSGDELLKTIAVRVGRLLQRGDFAARLGSDELALLINGIDQEQAASNVMQACLDEIQHPINLDGITICPRASVGSALYPSDGTHATALVKAAESAMNVAKSGVKRHYARYAPAMTQAAQHRLTMEHELQTAFRRGQFLLHYQPQVDAVTGETCGVEALLRWAHPERGLVPPLEFIPIAEKTGLIDALGEWVLHTACRQAADWISAGNIELPVAVNISPLQLLDAHFVVVVRNALQCSGLPAELLELEITESAFQTHNEARLALATLRDLGVRIAIDDFGTGYSSLASLKELHIDRVKIDRGFIADMLLSELDTTLLGNIIDMVHLLGCEVVAEGVESEEHVEKLQTLSCDCLQGYYFSRPIAADQLPEIVYGNSCQSTLEEQTA